ncbi:MAG TPA: alpha/beta hydrolase [Candidatus Acidoferrales bacterium]|nr:alpha/beta hydrolase [Candidatus Acidoferrales bacterium]
MTSPRSRYVSCCGYELHVLEWGAPDAPPIVAWHGIARNAADFATLGNALSTRFRVIAPDTIGRGLSQWSANPETDYTIPFYVRLAHALLDELAIERAGWIGTSMGGIVGLAAAATLLRDRISALLLNDVTPAAPDIDGLRRIAGYMGNPPQFDTVAEYETYVRAVYAPAGVRGDDAWRTTAQASLRRLPDGKVTTHYDPAIARAFDNLETVGDLWDAYDTLSIPVLLIRGERSDIARASDAALMQERGPKARVRELPAIGHAPWLDTPEQIDLVRDFFTASLG